MDRDCSQSLSRNTLSKGLLRRPPGHTQTDRQTGSHTHTHTETHSDTHTLRHREAQRHTHKHCFVFFYKKVSQVQPQEETEEGLRKTKFIALMGPRDRRHSTSHRTAGRDALVVRKQE